MADTTSKKGENKEGKKEFLGSGTITVPTPKFIFRYKEKDRGVKHKLSDVRTVALLESAYKIGATHEQAALFAGVAPQTILNWVSEKATLDILDNDGEVVGEITYSELVNFWKGHFRLQAKKKIYESVTAEGTGTTDAWRVLERQEANEWGLKVGQEGVDTGVTINLGEESKARLEKYQ